MIHSILLTDRSTLGKLKELTLTVIDDCPGRLFLYCGKKVSDPPVFSKVWYMFDRRD